MSQFVPHKNLTEDKLLKYGFEKFGLHTFRISYNVYKKLISASVYVDMDDKSVDVDVIMNNTREQYHPYYYDANYPNDLVAKEVKDKCNIITSCLCENKIIFDKEEAHEKKILRKSKNKPSSSKKRQNRKISN